MNCQNDVHCPLQGGTPLTSGFCHLLPAGTQRVNGTGVMQGILHITRQSQ